MRSKAATNSAGLSARITPRLAESPRGFKTQGKGHLREISRGSVPSATRKFRGTASPAAAAPAAASFGSYQEEHPAAPQAAPTLTTRVTAMGKTIDGRPTVTFEGGALWLLDEVDPLLAVGDTVTVSRGVLGSFLLETPGKRLHHVRRIR